VVGRQGITDVLGIFREYVVGLTDVQAIDIALLIDLRRRVTVSLGGRKTKHEAIPLHLDQDYQELNARRDDLQVPRDTKSIQEFNDSYRRDANPCDALTHVRIVGHMVIE